ncbi:MAG: queuosine precursor transporter [Chlamydiia bacterium]|nr:queuosine precursor transporter [Chlamydiia bacterium]
MTRSLPSQIIYQVICSVFSVIVVISSILSAKMIMLPLFHLQVPAGLVIYPITFLLSDLVTEVFGAKYAKLMVYVALAMSLLSFAIIQVGLVLPGTDSETNKAFQTLLGLTGLRIFSSLIAYLTSQIVDIQLYAAIKRWTGPKWLWLRNNGSICISQIIDTVMIDLIFLWWGLGMTLAEVAPIMVFSYLYKACFSIACTPLFYVLVFLVRGKWLVEINFFRSGFVKTGMKTKGVTP